MHLVRVSGRGELAKVQLAQVRDAVTRDFQAQRRRDANGQVLEQLRRRYQITIDEAAITEPTPELLKTAQVTP
jgi:hypothetical protein